MFKNVLVAQSGGPSPAINASLFGVIEGCRAYPDKFGKIYAGCHGIEGVLNEELLDLSSQDNTELALLPFTPSAGAVGTCRYKLPDEHSEDYRRILDVFRAHEIGYFFYIGGNDSMDTADKIARLARQSGYELTVTGVPKTIDNDVGDPLFHTLDHTPGYGSCARYWAYLMQNADEENRAIHPSECVSVYQAMGRKAGFITAASRLGDPERRMPMLLFFAESGFNLETLSEKVNDKLKEAERCIVVVNEGFDIGDAAAKHDGFGHIEYGASGNTAMQATVSYLNAHHLSARGQATGQIPGVMQRSCSLFMSDTDIDEAQKVGYHAVEIALKDGGGYMATIIRLSNSPYRAGFSKVTLAEVACSERFLPQSWITADGTDVTDSFIEYGMPLIGGGTILTKFENGLQRFARLKPLFAEVKLDKYIPCGMRTK